MKHTSKSTWISKSFKICDTNYSRHECETLELDMAGIILLGSEHAGTSVLSTLAGRHYLNLCNSGQLRSDHDNLNPTAVIIHQHSSCNVIRLKRYWLASWVQARKGTKLVNYQRKQCKAVSQPQKQGTHYLFAFTSPIPHGHQPAK